MDGTFEYKPLDLSKNEIRLISISPASWASDKLEGRLFHVPLEEAPPYEALSYVWGSHQLEKSQPVPSTSGTFDFHLNSNLEAALRYLRYPKKKLVIWIDAICINQYNTEERNEQVSKMRLIYKGAQEVRVWLGESYENSGVAFDFIREL
ncbi:heterokaryon incompatibility protein-domain-containing protein, partial [Tricladium varicosporioides]